MNSKKRYNVIMNFHSILKKERKTQNNKNHLDKYKKTNDRRYM
jgi:hypothetical protein